MFKDTGLKQHHPFMHSSRDQESNMKVSPAPSAQGGPEKCLHSVPFCLEMNVSHPVREDRPPQLGGLRSGPAGSTQHPRAPAGTPGPPSLPERRARSAGSGRSSPRAECLMCRDQDGGGNSRPPASQGLGH